VTAEAILRRDLARLRAGQPQFIGHYSPATDGSGRGAHFNVTTLDAAALAAMKLRERAKQ
jgi:hypothetical protein